ncbi:hypothetical protein FYJ43_09790 [Cutibacterium sp. WCA-380-WT-3A]|uniref:Alpha/beta hydrolase n=1 Tax=Cutibacterium porci TaxID=2605781 RepID=A0A7K0J8L7_9ACTN|nr:hypothetical protein [Cutibacterium porci]MSS46304.1 hypothetical protein [Cutibacterium porci]
MSGYLHFPSAQNQLRLWSCFASVPRLQYTEIRGNETLESSSDYTFWHTSAGTVRGLLIGRGDMLVIFLPGGPDQPVLDRYTAAFSWLGQPTATMWMPGPSGADGLGTVHRRRIVGAWGVQDLRELRALIGLSHEREFSSVLLVRHSYGAYLALLSADAPLEGIIAVAPFVNVEDLWKSIASSRVPPTEWGLDSPKKRSMCGKIVSPSERKTRHMCVMWSPQDTVTPPTKELRTYLSELCIMPGDILEELSFDHSLVKHNDALSVQQAMQEFFDKNFGIRSSRDPASSRRHFLVAI